MCEFVNLQTANPSFSHPKIIDELPTPATPAAGGFNDGLHNFMHKCIICQDVDGRDNPLER
jgi:hypothetical protein